jgi:hypothetical protein
VAWNIVNYLDPDRVPQGGMEDDRPWTHVEGGEAIPLINEIAFQAARPTASARSNHYEFAVELWFPFAPAIVQPSDKFFLQVGVFTNLETTATAPTVMSKASPKWSFTVPITDMKFDTPTEFLVVHLTRPKPDQLSYTGPHGGNRLSADRRQQARLVPLPRAEGRHEHRFRRVIDRHQPRGRSHGVPAGRCERPAAPPPGV